MKNLLNQSKIASKIGYSYTLTLSVAVLGTIFGLAVGETWQKQALNQMLIANEQKHLLNQLENTVKEVRSHPQRLVTVLGDSIWFTYEQDKFQQDIRRIETLTQQLQEFVQENPYNLVVSSEQIATLSQAYQDTTQSYTDVIRQLWETLDPANITPQTLNRSQQQLIIALTQSELVQISIEFERLSEHLGSIIKAAEAQREQSEQRFTEAEIIRLEIIIGSILLSVAIATLLAYTTSRAIVNPLKTLTQVAEQVVKDSNFTLQVPITTQDEISSLAQSFNQLITSVGQYTHDLQYSHQTLENRVQERTQELSQTLLELKQTQSKLLQSEKMSSLGQLVAGIAHEINNPVNFIYGNLTYAKQYTQAMLNLMECYQQCYPEPPQALQAEIENADLSFIQEDLPKLMSSMLMGTERIREIVKSLRTFSRLDEAELKTVDLHEGLESTLMILQNRLKAKPDRPSIQIITKYSKLPLIECYPGQLNQVFLNILTNAIDTLEEKLTQDKTFIPTITLSTQLSDASQVMIQIADNGLGMSEATQKQLFDPFFTTKAVGKGTGLGLSISYQIVVDTHQGQLICESMPGFGTEFAIIIPIHQLTSSRTEKLSTVVTAHHPSAVL